MMSRPKLRSSRRSSWNHDFDDLTSVLQDADMALAKVKSQLYSKSPIKASTAQTNYPASFNQFSTPYGGPTSAQVQYNKLQGLLTQQELGSKVNSTSKIDQSSTSHDLLMSMFEKLENQQQTINRLSQTIQNMEKQQQDQALAMEQLQEKLASIEDITHRSDSKEQSKLSQLKLSHERYLREIEDRIDHVEEMTILTQPNTDMERRFANMIDDYKRLERNMKTLTFSVSQLENGRRDSYVKSSPKMNDNHLYKEIATLINDQKSQVKDIQQLGDRQNDYTAQLLDLCNTVTNLKQRIENETTKRKKSENVMRSYEEPPSKKPDKLKKNENRLPSSNRFRKTDFQIPAPSPKFKVRENDDASLQFTTNYSDIVTLSDIDTDELLQSSSSSNDTEDLFS